MSPENPLGKPTPVAEHYSPHLLFPIARERGWRELDVQAEDLPFQGEDVWHAWEVSWLTPGGKPEMRVGRFRVPCASPNLIESKSLKLYLNSLNQTVFVDQQALEQVLQSDLSAVAGATVRVELIPLESELLAIQPPPGGLCGWLATHGIRPSPGRQPVAGH